MATISSLGSSRRACDGGRHAGGVPADDDQSRHDSASHPAARVGEEGAAGQHGPRRLARPLAVAPCRRANRSRRCPRRSTDRGDGVEGVGPAEVDNDRGAPRRRRRLRPIGRRAHEPDVDPRRRAAEIFDRSIEIDDIGDDLHRSAPLYARRVRTTWALAAPHSIPASDSAGSTSANDAGARSYTSSGKRSLGEGVARARAPRPPPAAPSVGKAHGPAQRDASGFVHCSSTSVAEQGPHLADRPRPGPARRRPPPRPRRRHRRPAGQQQPLDMVDDPAGEGASTPSARAVA